MLKNMLLFGIFAVLAMGLTISCASAPDIQPDPDTKPPPPPEPAGFVMKPFQRSMGEEMLRSYDLADEIIIGVFENSHEDKASGLNYNFQDFSTFDKTTLSWGETMNVLMKILPDKIIPEIIFRTEYKDLIELDKEGICWDVYEGDRNVFLVEGRKNLIFVQVGYDEANNRSYRKLIDSYPITEICRADDVFNLMIRTHLSPFPF